MIDKMHERQMTIAEVQGHLLVQLEQLGDDALTITLEGKPVGVLLAPHSYRKIQRAYAYTQLIALAKELRKSGVEVDDLLAASRAEREH